MYSEIQRSTFYHKMRKEHKILVKHTAQKFKEQLLDKINSLESNNPKDFWSMVNSMKEAKQNNIIESFSPQILKSLIQFPM